MKCPKCGFNSFETHDACKKCGNDLTNYKDIHGLKPIVLPVETRAAMAEKMMAEMVPEEKHEETEVHSDMFSFDVPEPVAPTGSDFSTDDPFNFDDVSTAPASADPFGGGEDAKSAQQKAEEDAFADLLESTSQAEAPAPVKAAASDPDDLSNFSWDDTPEVADDKPAKSGDDFDDLFGDSDATKK
jgi:hypothetical protein